MHSKKKNTLTYFQTLCGHRYIRVQTKMEECGITQETDDYSEKQFENLKKMGTLWWEKFGSQVMDLILLDAVCTRAHFFSLKFDFF